MHGHGGGLKTEEGRARIAATHTISGRETRAIRKDRAEKLAELRLLEQQMYKLGMLKQRSSKSRSG